MTDSPVIFEKDGRLARITLNRPEVLNAIDERIPRLLQDAVEKANVDENLRVIVLSGAGKTFCAGYDLKSYAEAEGNNPGFVVTSKPGLLPSPLVLVVSGLSPLMVM